MMDSETDGQAEQPVATAASARMRAAREAAGLSLAEVAQRTRVPLRHLEALERGDYGSLPGITYCAGFTRAFARAVGLDEKALVAQVRAEIEQTGDLAVDQYQIDEPADPARVPPRALAWVAAIIALLLAGGYALWRMQINTPPGEETMAAGSVQPKPAQRPRPVAPPRVVGPVVLTSVEDVWLRIYDAGGKPLFEKILSKGESFTVPEGANNPMILTGRPDALAVTVGGRPVPPLGTAERTISDVPISAQALLARGTTVAPVSAAPGGSVAPQPSTAPQTPRPVTAEPQQRPAATAPKPAVAQPSPVATSTQRRPTQPATPTASPAPAAPAPGPASNSSTP
jgi:cytoskeletal protein RodZ